MSYVPINPALFVAVYAGSLSGMAASGRYPIIANPAEYDPLQSIAGAFAQTFDTLWNSASESQLDLSTAQALAQGVWQDRFPLSVADYQRECSALIAILVSAGDAFTSNGWNPGDAGGVPPPADILGAGIFEDPAGVRISTRIKQAWIDPSFAITSWAKTGPNGAQLLYRRGDTINTMTAAATYNNSPLDYATVSSVLANGAVGAGAWTTVSPFATATKAGTLTGNGTDATPDPTCVSTLTADDGSGAVTAAFTVTFTSDVYAFVSASSSIVGTDVFNVTLQAGAQESLQQNRNHVWTLNQVGQYAYFLWPNRAPYTNGTPTFKDQNGFIYATVAVANVSILRNGVTQTYTVYRSGAALSAPFTVTVT